MIFRGNYNQVLLAILAGNKKNRNKIIDLISSLPIELREKINTSIEIYATHVSETSFNESYSDAQPTLFEIEEPKIEGLEDEAKDEAGFTYSYKIDQSDGSLTLSKSQEIDGKFYEIDCLTLNDVNIKKFMENNYLFNEDDIGLFSTNFSETIIDHNSSTLGIDEYEYSIYKTPLGIILLTGLNDHNDRLSRSYGLISAREIKRIQEYFINKELNINLGISYTKE